MSASANANAQPAMAPGAPVPPRAFPQKHFLNDGQTVRSWLLTADHKRIAIMFLVAILIALFVGGMFALALRVELLTPKPDVMDALTYNRMFTLHGLVMIFF